MARRLSAIDAPGDEYGRVTGLYRAAARRVSKEGSRVLGDKNFLADDALHKLGLTDCVAAERK